MKFVDADDTDVDSDGQYGRLLQEWMSNDYPFISHIYKLCGTQDYGDHMNTVVRGTNKHALPLTRHHLVKV